MVATVDEGNEGELLGQACQIVHQVVLNTDQLARLEDGGIWADFPDKLVSRCLHTQSFPKMTGCLNICVLVLESGMSTERVKAL